MTEKVLQYLDDHEYFLLIISHITMLIFYPFVMETGGSSLRVHILISLILITGLYAVNTHTKFVMETMLLGIFAFVLTWVNFVFNEMIITLLLNIVGLLFFSVITYHLVIHLHDIEHVDKHMIFGAVAGYLLL